MSSPDWIRWYPARWLTGVLHLTNEQRGVYIQIINVIYDRGECPADYGFIGRFCNLRSHCVKRIVEELIEIGKLTQTGSKLHQNRTETELKRARNSTEKGRLAAAKRWEDNGLGDATTKCHIRGEKKESRKKDSETPPYLPSEEESSSGRHPPSPGGAPGNGQDRSRGTRLSADWEPGERGVEYARKLGLSADIINTTFHAFMRYWLAKAGQAARKVDWDLTWQTWVRREHDKLREQEARERRWAEQRRAH